MIRSWYIWLLLHRYSVQPNNPYNFPIRYCQFALLCRISPLFSIPEGCRSECIIWSTSSFGKLYGLYCIKQNLKYCKALFYNSSIEDIWKFIYFSEMTHWTTNREHQLDVDSSAVWWPRVKCYEKVIWKIAKRIKHPYQTYINSISSITAHFWNIPLIILITISNNSKIA